MKPEPDSGSPWDRVAAELRACREAQQRAWGDIDNLTLGRFLADEVTPDERQQIENALDELPELRKLTDLVRDVLGATEAAALPTAPVPPPILPFPQTPQIRSKAPERMGRTWLRDARFRQRAGLAAAAGLLLVLSFTLPRPGETAAPAEGSLVFSQPVAMRVALSPDGNGLMAGSSTDTPALFRAAEENESNPTRDERVLLDHMAVTVQTLEAEGKAREAERLARRYAHNLTRKAWAYQEKGDLVRAEPALNQACMLCDRTLGPDAPETIRTRNHLAGVYEAALNLTPPQPSLSRSDAFGAFALEQKKAPAPAAVKQERFTLPLPAPAPRQHPAPRAMASASHPERTMKDKGAQTTHTYYQFPSQSQTAPAVALRERLTRKSQGELRTSVVPVLTRALRQASDSDERQRLARALGQLGPAARDAVPLLLDCYRRSTDAAERATLLSVVADIGPAARQALPVVLDVVRHAKDHPPHVYLSARRALIRLAPAARCHRDDPARRPGAAILAEDVFQYVDTSESRSGIVDEAECFSVHALRVNQDQIHHLAKTYRIEVLIETVPGPAATDDRERLAHNGVYLRISRDAPQVQVFVSERLSKRGLTEARLRQVVEPSLRKKDFDRGLQAGVEFLADFEAKQLGD